MRNTKLIIVGGGVTKDHAPYDSDLPIWSTFSVGQHLPRCDVAFELHDNVYTVEQLSSFKGKIFLKEHNDKIPNGERFPIEKLIYEFGRKFNGTVTMMLAYAYIEGYTEIELYGVDMSTPEESGRRAMFLHIMGMLEGLGCKITFANGGHLTDTCPTYMYDYHDGHYAKDMKQRAENQLAEDNKLIEQLTSRAAYARGMIDALEAVIRREQWL